MCYYLKKYNCPQNTFLSTTSASPRTKKKMNRSCVARQAAECPPMPNPRATETSCSAASLWQGFRLDPIINGDPDMARTRLPVRTSLSIASRIRRIPVYLTDSDVSLWKKLAVLAGVLYVLSPIDAVSDFIPVVGWLDDLGVLGLTYFFMMRELADYRPSADEPSRRGQETEARRRR
jgi:uncharacterized membrane protein YkvA (DUF1232 family)